jgi:hypothetical protein
MVFLTRWFGVTESDADRSVANNRQISMATLGKFGLARRMIR